MGHEGSDGEQMCNFGTGHPVVLIIKLKVYIYIS